MSRVDPVPAHGHVKDNQTTRYLKIDTVLGYNGANRRDLKNRSCLQLIQA